MNLTRLTRTFLAIMVLLCLRLSSFCQYTDHSPNVSQNQPPPPAPASHAIYTEIGGPGMLLSLNYDTRLTQRKDGFGIRAGVGYSFGGNPSFFSVPVGLNYLAGHGGNFFELGAGATFVDIEGADFGHRYSIGGESFDHPARVFFGNSVLGYRYQPSHGGLNVRAGISPYFGSGAGGILPYFSLGYNF
jgi:hypothetical protein